MTPDSQALLRHPTSAAPMELEPADRERLATALAFYLARLKWAEWDLERVEFERLLAEMGGR